MSNEFNSLQSQLATLIHMQQEQTKQLNALQEQFQQAKGALALLKWGLGISVAIATFIATFWDAIHRITGK